MPVLTPRRIAVVAIAAWLVIAAVSVCTGPPLGHDEAAFATAARGGAPAWLYRSVGVIWIARIGVALGASELALRLTSALLGAGVVIAAWRVGTRAFGEVTGAWAAAAIATAHPMTLRSAELIGDLPATACVLAGLAVLIGELGRPDGDGPRWRLVAAAPAFAAAFYLRYASAPVIALAGVVAVVIWPRAIAKRPLAVIATIVALAALLAPHLVYSLHVTGSALGILETSASVPRNAYVGEGLVTYLTSEPLYFYGVLIAPLALLGVVGVVRRPTRPAVFLATVALAQLVAIGLKSHAQPRYVFIASTLLAVIGVDTVVRACRDRPRVARAGAAAVALAWLGAAVAMVPYNRWLAGQRGPVMAAAAAIRIDAAGAPCLVACRVVTQLMWYTRCDGFLLHDPAKVPPWPAELRRYVVSVPHGTTTVEPIASLEHATPVALPTGHPQGLVWRLEAAAHADAR